jgi:hypothetical protein
LKIEAMQVMATPSSLGRTRVEEKDTHVYIKHFHREEWLAIFIAPETTWRSWTQTSVSPQKRRKTRIVVINLVIW